jgi:hypothetical protein
MGGALLVPHQNVVYARVDQVVIDGQRLPSRITEHHVHALPFEQRQDRFGAFHKLIPHNPAIIEAIPLKKDASFK